METLVRTVYGAILQTTQLVGKPFVLKEYTTLNEKFGIQAGILPTSTEIPRCQYMAIGLGGHRAATGADGIMIPEPIQHRPTDAGLYKHLPFVLRELTNDLSPTDRAKYALRRIEEHNGNNYAAYYLRRLDLTNVTPEMLYKTVNDGVVTTTPFVPTSANLNPTPPDLSSTGVNVTTGDYVTATAKLSLIFTTKEINELLNAANVMFGDERLAIISEIALVSGVDKTIQVSGSGQATFNFNEVIAAQIVSILNTMYMAKYADSGIDLTIDIGSSEPMWNSSTI